MNTFGISTSDMELIKKFSEHEKVLEVILYNSRAKGTYNERSDVDLVICNSNLDRHLLGKIILEINNSNFFLYN